MRDHFHTKTTLSADAGGFAYHRLAALEERGFGPISRLPYAIRVLLEAALRQCAAGTGSTEEVERLARWSPQGDDDGEFGFLPARVLLQDFTGVPAVVDLAAMRDAVAALGGDPQRVNPSIPVDLVIDHSVQVDAFGGRGALAENVRREFGRNGERYAFLKWGQRAFRDFRVVPPATGIVHQVNLEHLATVVRVAEIDGERWAFPDSVVGTDSHTTMINGLGVLGWGVGGIEAEAAMLGQAIPMTAPRVVGVELVGALREGVTATDLVLAVTQVLRAHGVVDKFVEFHGPGVDLLSLADRATIANMAPEYGATVGFFPVDDETLRYLRLTGRDARHVDLVERALKAQGLFREPGAPVPAYSERVVIDLSEVEPALAGPKRPQDRVPLSKMKSSFLSALAAGAEANGYGIAPSAPPVSGRAAIGGRTYDLGHGAVVIAAITSCTNTSNPSVMIAAGLLAKKAAERGLAVPAYVKTSLAPGSRAVSAYLDRAGLLEPLERLGFAVVGYGCTTCIGNSGPLDDEVSAAIERAGLVAASVLSGNRNFEGRVHPAVKANYLASPPLVVAYALAGRVDIDMATEPLGLDAQGREVYLRDLWPSDAEVREAMAGAVDADAFRAHYKDVFAGGPEWRDVRAPDGDRYDWDPASTYIRHPPFFEADRSPAFGDIVGARALAVLGDSVTTDHISPAGNISSKGPAARYLMERGVVPADFNSYGARRGNHEVMMRGTFANVRLRNLMAGGAEGGVTVHVPSGEPMSIYDAAMRYKDERVPLVIVAGKDYGMGSSRDWAAKGPALLGVRAVLFESIERIHRSNLVGMGILPLEFAPGENAKSLGLTGLETFDILGLSDGVLPGKKVRVVARRENGDETAFIATCRVRTPAEADYVRCGGIMPYVVRSLARQGARMTPAA